VSLPPYGGASQLFAGQGKFAAELGLAEDGGFGLVGIFSVQTVQAGWFVTIM